MRRKIRPCSFIFHQFLELYLNTIPAFPPLPCRIKFMWMYINFKCLACCSLLWNISDSDTITIWIYWSVYLHGARLFCVRSLCFFQWTRWNTKEPMMVLKIGNFNTSSGFIIAFPKFPKKTFNNILIGMSFGGRFLKPFLQIWCKNIENLQKN